MICPTQLPKRMYHTCVFVIQNTPILSYCIHWCVLTAYRQKPSLTYSQCPASIWHNHEGYYCLRYCESGSFVKW